MSEYFQRTLRLKPLIERDEDICRRLRSAFKSVYDNSSEKDVSPSSDNLLKLGRGNKHTVVGLQRTIVDPANDREIHLAVKFNHEVLPYFLGNPEVIKKEIGHYDYAFNHEFNPLYFVLLATVEAYVPVLYSMERVAGILMEDISHGKTLPLIESSGSEFCIRRTSAGGLEQFFIDPDNCSSTNGSLYFSPEARLDL